MLLHCTSRKFTNGKQIAWQQKCINSSETKTELDLVVHLCCKVAVVVVVGHWHHVNQCITTSVCSVSAQQRIVAKVESAEKRIAAVSGCGKNSTTICTKYWCWCLHSHRQGGKYKYWITKDLPLSLWSRPIFHVTKSGNLSWLKFGAGGWGRLYNWQYRTSKQK